MITVSILCAAKPICRCRQQHGGSWALLMVTAGLCQAWAEDMAAFVKGLDTNHLVMLGTIGMFGASTPALTKLNPFDLVADTTSKGGIYSGDPICQVGALSASLQIDQLSSMEHACSARSRSLAERPRSAWCLRHTESTPALARTRLVGLQGEDFSGIVGLSNVDIGSVHVYLESWPICTQCVVAPSHPQHV